MSARTSKHTDSLSWLKDFAALLGRPDENLPPPGYVDIETLAKACGKTHATSNFKNRVGVLVANKQLDRHDGSRYDTHHKRLVRSVTYRWMSSNKTA